MTILWSLASLPFVAGAQTPQGVQVIPKESQLIVPVGGLENTNSVTSIESVAGMTFSRALHVIVKKGAKETNATQMTIPLSSAVAKGDVILAEFWIRGADSKGKSPATIEFLFEKSTDPWTKSVTQVAAANRDASAWKHFLIPFQSSDSYQPGTAMISLRFALQPQHVEVGGLSVVNFGKSFSLDQLVENAAMKSPLGSVTVEFDFAQRHQTMLGMGGDFCQPRYGSAEAMDDVGLYALTHLQVAHARIGLPLNFWNPERGVYKDDAQARASFLALQDMNSRGIPRVVSIWEGPKWMLGGQPEQSGRELAPERYGDCIDSIAKYLVVARDKYGVKVDYVSFNEPDYGVNFKFTPKTMSAFIRQAGPKFASLKLTTKFLVGDTANGTNFHDFAEPLLQDRSIEPFLGPIAFHCWDGLGASEASYQSIAELGQRFHKPILCLEAGHDAGLWQAPNPWASWDNALKTAQVYERTVRLTEASVMDYWTYQDNYPLVNKVGLMPYPVFRVIHQMESVFAPKARIVHAKLSQEGLQAIGSILPGSESVAMMFVNSSGPGILNLKGLPKNHKFKELLSNREEQELGIKADQSNANGELTIIIPMRSIITLQSAH